VTNSLRLVDGATSIWLRPAQPTGLDAIFLQTSDIPLASPRVVEQERPGRSGHTDLTSLHDATTFRARVLIRDDNIGSLGTRHQILDTLRGMTAANKRPYLYVQRDGWPAERRALLRGDSASCVVDRLAAVLLDVSLQYVIPAGVLEDTTTQTAVLRPTTVTSGRTYAKTYPWAYTPSSAGSTVTATSSGNVSTPPVLRLYGGFTEPIVANLTTGQVIELDGVSLAAGQYLEIDVDARTVRLNGDPSLSYYNKINFGTTSWWELQPGANLITMSAGTQDATCELDVIFNDRWA
jgi:hypothetical protein